MSATLVLDADLVGSCERTLRTAAFALSAAGNTDALPASGSVVVNAAFADTLRLRGARVRTLADATSTSADDVQRGARELLAVDQAAAAAIGGGS